MKSFLIVAAIIAVVGAVPQNHGAGSGLSSILTGLTATLAGQLERSIKAALEGQAINALQDDNIIAKELNILEGLPLLPSLVRINANLTDVKHFGIADIVPVVNVDLIRLSIHANYKLPAFTIAGGYALEVTSNFNPDNEEAINWLVLNGNSNEATFVLSDLELDVSAKLKWTLLGGFRVDTLDYTLGEFGLSASLPNLKIMEDLIDISSIVDPVLGWWLKKEILDIEAENHEPLVQAIRDFIDFLLKGGLIG